VSKATDVSAKQITKVLDSFFNVLVDNVCKEEKIHCPIGTFIASHRVARIGRNPQNGEPINIPAANTLKFKVSGAVKEKLNK